MEGNFHFTFECSDDVLGGKKRALPGLLQIDFTFDIRQLLYFVQLRNINVLICLPYKIYLI